MLKTVIILFFFRRVTENELFFVLLKDCVKKNVFSVVSVYERLLFKVQP